MISRFHTWNTFLFFSLHQEIVEAVKLEKLDVETDLKSEHEVIFYKVNEINFVKLFLHKDKLLGSK